MINVRSAPFYANGDGISDDRPAIQMALDYAAAYGIRTVYLPEGDYGLSRNPAVSHPLNHCLRVQGRDRVSLIGEGRFGTRLFVLPSQATVGRVLLIHQSSRVEVAHMTIDGNKQARGYTSTLPAGMEDELINMKSGETFYLHDLRLLNSAADAIDGDAVEHVTASQLYVKDCNGNALHLGGADQVMVSDSEFINNAHVRLASGGDSGADAATIDLRQSGTYWRISNCLLLNNARGLVNEASMRGGISNTTIIGGDYGWYGISGGVLVQGVWFKGQTKAAIRADGGSLKSLVTGSHFEAQKMVYESRGGVVIFSADNIGLPAGLAA